MFRDLEPANFYPVITLLKTQLILDNLPLCISPAPALLHKQHELIVAMDHIKKYFAVL